MWLAFCAVNPGSIPGNTYWPPQALLRAFNELSLNVQPPQKKYSGYLWTDAVRSMKREPSKLLMVSKVLCIYIIHVRCQK